MVKHPMKLCSVLCAAVALTACACGGGTAKKGDEIFLYSGYEGKNITLKVDAYGFRESGNTSLGKARYLTQKDESGVKEEIEANGATFFEVEGYRFFKLNGEGAYSLRLEESTDKTYPTAVTVDDMSCVIVPDLHASESQWESTMPFPYFVLDNNGADEDGMIAELHFGYEYAADADVLLGILRNVGVWTVTEGEDGYLVSYRDMSLRVSVDGRKVLLNEA